MTPKQAPPIVVDLFENLPMPSPAISLGALHFKTYSIIKDFAEIRTSINNPILSEARLNIRDLREAQLLCRLMCRVLKFDKRDRSI